MLVAILLQAWLEFSTKDCVDAFPWANAKLGVIEMAVANPAWDATLAQGHQMAVDPHQGPAVDPHQGPAVDPHQGPAVDQRNPARGSRRGACGSKAAKSAQDTADLAEFPIFVQIAMKVIVKGARNKL